MDETYEIIGICMEVHRVLGHGFLEIVYKDAIEFELLRGEYPYSREKQYQILYKGTILRHSFFADFVVMDKVVLEVKAAEGGLANDHVAQTLNYLKTSGCKVGLLVNFGRRRLEYRRFIF
ncbi:MAG: GxxExxY protein [Cytophagales bacterium]|nr:GxxExxY protein [Cytophagales bacterium]